MLRATIPVTWREKVWMGLALTVMLLFGLMMATVAGVAIRSVSSTAALRLIPLGLGAFVVLLYLLSLLALRGMPGNVIELDSKSLSLGSIGSKRRQNWPLKKIKSLSVSRLPMVPVANLVIQLHGDPAVRTAICNQRDLRVAADRLRSKLGMKAESAT